MTARTASAWQGFCRSGLCVMVGLLTLLRDL